METEEIRARQLLDEMGISEELVESMEEQATQGDFAEGFAGATHQGPYMGRPRLFDEPLRARTVTLPVSLIESIDRRTDNRSAFIREALASCL